MRSLRPRAAWVVLATGTLLAIPTAVDPEGPAAAPTYLAGLVVIVAALWTGAARLPPAERRPWLLVAATATCWLAGDTVQRVLARLDLAEAPIGLPDVFWLASYPLLVGAVVHMLRARGLPQTAVREIRLDVLVVAAACTVGAWDLLILPGLHDGGSKLEIIVGALYPLGDVGIFALALTLIIAPGRRGSAGILLICCMGLTLPLDLLQSLLSLAGWNAASAPLDGAFLVVNSLLGAAGLHPSRTQLSTPAPRSPGRGIRRWRVVLLGASLCGVSISTAIPKQGALQLVPSIAATLLVSVVVFVRFYGAIRDQERAEAALQHQVHHDQLTGAANRELLMQRLDEASLDRQVTLVFVDLDGFKRVNDTHGHHLGDHVLRTVTDRLTALVRSTDTVARVGGDEFVLLCHGVTDADAEALGHRIARSIRRPVVLGDVEVVVGASVGVLGVDALLEQEALRRGAIPLPSADDLLRTVDAAMYEAKRDGGGVRRALALT